MRLAIGFEIELCEIVKKHLPECAGHGRSQEKLREIQRFAIPEFPPVHTISNDVAKRPQPARNDLIMIEAEQPFIGALYSFWPP